MKGLLIPIPTKDPTLQPDFKITLSLNFTCFTFYSSAIQTHTLDIPLSGMTTGIVIKFINTNGCLSSANMFSCFNSISTYLHRAHPIIYHNMAYMACLSLVFPLCKHVFMFQSNCDQFASNTNVNSLFSKSS